MTVFSSKKMLIKAQIIPENGWSSSMEYKLRIMMREMLLTLEVLDISEGFEYVVSQSFMDKSVFY